VKGRGRGEKKEEVGGDGGTLEKEKTAALVLGSVRGEGQILSHG